MTIIVSSYLDMCTCGEHGHVVLSDGRRGREFCTRPAAREEIKELLEHNKITEEEATFLRDCVSKADSLPENEEYVHIFAELACEATNIGLANPMTDSGPSKQVH